MVNKTRVLRAVCAWPTNNKQRMKEFKVHANVTKKKQLKLNVDHHLTVKHIVQSRLPCRVRVHS